METRSAASSKAWATRPGVTTSYGYDSIYELLSATQGSTTTESYNYDAVGNRTSSLGVSSYTTNASNELTATSNATYTYDSNGNTLTKTDSTGTTSYAWDFENRLTSVTLPGTGGTVTFKYDSFGRRIEKSSSAATSIYAYDADNLIEETNSSGTVVARYTQTQNIDEPLTMLRSSATSYYNADGLGSVTSLTNSAGAAAETYTYDSFGALTASSGSLVNPFRYTGRELDSETNLYFYRARYYDSISGRFIAEDPLRFLSGDGDFYAYVFNSPVNWEDPSGYSCHCTYSQSTGHLVCKDLLGNTVVDVFGYSGIGLGKNNPNMVGAFDVGPIPGGTYYIGKAFDGPLGHPQIPLKRRGGKFDFPISRDPDSFLFHADNSAHPGQSSNGCIVIDQENRKKIAGCAGGTLDVGP